MKHLFLILSTVFSLIGSSMADVSVSELKGFDILSLNGTYSAANGDKVEVKVTPVEDVQGELFGPSEYSVTAVLTINGIKENYNIYELDTWQKINYEVLPKQGQFILKSKVECEDPGCEWSEVSLTFTKNKDGTVEVTYDFTYGAEVNEYFADRDFPSIDELTQFCQENFGPITTGNSPDESFLYCEAFSYGTMK
jgi:hypothetical protein